MPSEKTVRELPKTFIGRAEVRGFEFVQLEASDKAFLYEVSIPGVARKHYEVFQRRINRRHKVISYPGAKSFGIWAWIYSDLKHAIAKYEEIA